MTAQDLADPMVFNKLADGLIYRFLSLVFKDAVATKSTDIVVAFDGSKVFRYEIWPSYKAKRTGDPTEHGVENPEGDKLIYRFLPVLCKALSDIQVTWVQKDKYEADDILRSLAHTAPPSWEVILGTKDKDSYQGLRPGVRLFVSDVKKPKVPYYVTHNDAEQKKGVPVDRMIDYQTLIGDSIDDIPPIEGVGPKKAQAIIKEYKDLKKWVAVKIKEDPKFRGIVPQLERNRKLVTLITDCYNCPTNCSVPKINSTKLKLLPTSVSQYMDQLYPKTKGLF